MQKRLLGFQGWLLLLAVGLLSSLAAAADRSPFEAVVARIGRGAAVGSGVLISREGLLVTCSSTVDAKGQGRVFLGGTEYGGKPLRVPGLRGLALLAITPPKGAEFHTLALGAGSQVQPGGRVQVAGPASALGFDGGGTIAAVETLVRDVEMDAATGIHYMKLELPYAPALAGAPVCSLDDQKLVGLIVPDGTGTPGCQAISVDSLKEALFDAGRPVRAMIAPGLKGGDVQASGPIASDGLLHRSQAMEWSFPIRSQSQTQDIGAMLSAQAWRDISGFQLAPLTPLRSYPGGGLYFATAGGVLYAVQPENQKMLWRYEANDGSVALFAPAVAEDNVFLATGNLGLLSQSHSSGDILVDLVIDLFGLGQRNALAFNQGAIHAVDRRTGQFKWMYETRLVGEPQVVGSRLCFGGLGVYGALDPGTGKEAWIHRDKQRKRDANWYCLKAGPDGVLYGLVVPVRVEGRGNKKDPLRLEGRGGVRALALDAATGTQRWNIPLFEFEKPSRQPMSTAVL